MNATRASSLNSFPRSPGEGQDGGIFIDNRVDAPSPTLANHILCGCPANTPMYWQSVGTKDTSSVFVESSPLLPRYRRGGSELQYEQPT